MDRRGKARDRVEQLALTQEAVWVRAEQTDRAGGEVDHPRASERHHQGQGQRREDRAVGQAQQQEHEQLSHGSTSFMASPLQCSSSYNPFSSGDVTIDLNDPTAFPAWFSLADSTTVEHTAG